MASLDTNCWAQTVNSKRSSNTTPYVDWNFWVTSWDSLVEVEWSSYKEDHFFTSLWNQMLKQSHTDFHGHLFNPPKLECLNDSKTITFDVTLKSEIMTVTKGILLCSEMNETSWVTWWCNQQSWHCFDPCFLLGFFEGQENKHNHKIDSPWNQTEWSSSSGT